jgi:hypothetical protein
MPVEIIPLLPSSLMKVPHIAAFDPIIRNYISSDTDLAVTQQGVPGTDPVETVINILNVETCAPEILPYLAEMFGVEGYKGFDYATNDEQRRSMIRSAMLKHERHGKDWTLETALTDAGYRNILITDQNNGIYVQFLDGTWLLDGSHQLNSNSWADFTVTLNPPVGVDAADVDVPKLIRYINYWKRGSSRLIGVTVAQIFFSNLTIGAVGPPARRYLDGSWSLDGTWTLDGY